MNRGTMSKNSSTHALRRGRGLGSTAALVADAGKYQHPTRKAQEAPMATLLGERLKGVDELEAAKRAFDGRADSKILIVGGRTTNLSRGARDHPRVLIWESTDLDKSGN